MIIIESASADQGPTHDFHSRTCRYAPKATVFPGPPSLGAEDIPDPLYGGADAGAGEAERLPQAIEQIEDACAGLLQHLIDLHDRCSSLLCT